MRICFDGGSSCQWDRGAGPNSVFTIAKDTHQLLIRYERVKSHRVPDKLLSVPSTYKKKCLSLFTQDSDDVGPERMLAG